jgi:hypothetical protein
VPFGYFPSCNSPKIFFIRSNAPRLTLFGGVFLSDFGFRISDFLIFMV